MQRFAIYRWFVMRRRGGFWVRKAHWSDDSWFFFPLFPWRWIAPTEPFTRSDFEQIGCAIHALHPPAARLVRE